MDIASNQDQNKITLEEVSKNCNHVGFISPPAQSLYVTDYQILVITTTSCSRCGKIYTHMTPITVNSPGAIAVPKKDIITKGP